MKDTINTYFAILLVTIFGSLATFVIVHIGTNDVITVAKNGNEASYAALQVSILKSR